MALGTLSTQFWNPTERPLDYTGVELRPHFVLSEAKVRGSALLAGFGSCEVKTDHLVDWEDRLEADFIRAKRMVHFLGEFFGLPLTAGVFLQRLFMAQVQAILAQATSEKIVRSGDDLFWGKKKLSVSIVTASPVSVLLHVGINVDATGAPVEAAGLADLGLSPDAQNEFTKACLKAFQEEWASMEWACVKVRPVI